VINEGVIAVSVKDLTIKEILLSTPGEALFTEPHYDNFPAVLVRLDAIGFEELEDLVIEAWRCKAPANLVADYDRRCAAS
jgi:hypothetical protein